MRWLIAGGYGMLAQDLIARLGGAGDDVVAVDRDVVDITDAAACDEAVRGFDVVANCAAWTAVDEAETHEPQAFGVNATGAANLARSAAAAGARMIQISTDYVFDGSATTPYREEEPQNPISAYGRTKAAGEWAVQAASPRHLIVRTAWLYGAGGANFAATMARLGRERGAVSVVDDQHGQPTWTVDLADLMVRLVEAGVPGGVYHGTSSGRTTWYGFARAVMASAGLDPEIVSPTSSADFVRPAPRPTFSVLDHGALDRVGVAPIGDWAERWGAAASTVLGPVD